ncbi:MAG: helix-turn-helix transcriptional regulator [Erysipelotrichaceae bacterium]|nr:helix-turn-helix transcriptional regulator [Erysipelotrichaceae bacterium]
MQLGKRIKELRIENNLTQESLAEQLGVSFQAVSRWENDLTYPDITLLPILANMFDVTVDFLLDVDVMKKEAEIDAIIEEYIVLLNQGKIDENLILLENAIKKYPNSWDIKHALLHIYFTKGLDPDLKEYNDKAIKLANEILEKCVDDAIRYGAMQTLILIYTSRKELDKAKQIVEKLPMMVITSEWLWPDVLTGEDRIRATQEIFKSFVDMFYIRLITTFGRKEVGKRDEALLKFKQFLDIVYENEDYGFYHLRLADIYKKCAFDQARIQNKEKTLEYLSFSLKHIRLWTKMYENKEVLSHTSFLVDRLVDDSTKWSFSGEPDYELDLKQDLEKDIFDFLRNDPLFINLFK